MTYFTDSPYEKMMQQTPRGGGGSPRPKPLPKDHRCHGCTLYGACCGVCHRNLIIHKKELYGRD